MIALDLPINRPSVISWISRVALIFGALTLTRDPVQVLLGLMLIMILNITAIVQKGSLRTEP